MVTVWLQPSAPRDAVVGEHCAALRITVRAYPQRGQANDALIRLLAQTLQLPRHRLELLRGHTSRRKQVLINGLSVQEVQTQLASLMSQKP
uniref:UPF0235 protein HGMM_F37F03C18 n=1 Tax=uncultured Planctomycetota bacterium TaxID=120965 RepID=H5SJQ9_9BACT|nr:hypothetical conserved protein [uncultured Planctomycetota bacterium]